MMNIHNPKWQHYYCFLESILLSFCVTLFVNTYFKLNIPGLLILIEILLFNGMLAIFNRSTKKGLSFVLGAFFIVLSLLLTSYLNINLLVYASKTKAWFQNFCYHNGPYIFHYAFSMILATALVTSICLYPLQSFKYSKLLIMLSLFIGLIGCCIQNITLSKGIIFLALTYNAGVLTQLTYQFQNKAHFLQYKNASIFLLPFSLLLALPVLILPNSQTPISWEFATDFARNIAEQTNNIFYDLQVQFGQVNNEFGIHLNRFNASDMTLLGGKITPRDDILLRIYVSSAFKNPIYLKGSIYNTYTGEAWKKENSPSIDGYNEFELDCYENLYNLYRSNLTVSEQVFHPVSIELNYEALHTKSLFYPDSTHQLSQLDSQNKLNTQNTNILFSRTQKRGLKYRLYFTETNLNHPTLTDYFRSLDHFHYTSTPKIHESLNTSKLSNNALFFQVATPDERLFTDRTNVNYAIFNSDLENILAKRASLIDESYTSLPETLPTRIYDLANKITKDAPTTYDKLKAIETYLRQFKYTKTPNSPPENQDFVDNFLFNTHEGYCTYFASAMVVLARCVNIPTRYVEGFVVISRDSNAYNTTYKLTSQSLHAWPEAYIEGYGWLTFEPTPGYSATADDSWVSKRYNTSDFSAPAHTDTPESSSLETQENSLDDLSTSIGEKKPLHIMLTFLLLPGIFVLLFILYIVYMALRHTRALKKGNANQKAKLLFMEILFCLQKRGYPKAPSQSLLDYALSVSKDDFIAKGTTFEQIVNTYFAYRYGHHLATAAELHTLYSYRKFLYAQTKDHFKAIKILIHKISFLLNGYK